MGPIIKAVLARIRLSQLPLANIGVYSTRLCLPVNTEAASSALTVYFTYFGFHIARAEEL